MPESTVLALAGILGMPITQLLKGVLKLEGPRMLWATWLISFAVMLIAAFVTNALGGSMQTILSSPDEFIKSASVVFSATTLFYGSIKGNLNKK